MAYAGPPVMGYPPPPGGAPLQPGAPSNGHIQGPDALTNALSGMTISSAANPASLPFDSAQYQPAPTPGHYAQSQQAHAQSFHSAPISYQSPISASQPPPVPSASTRPVYQAQSSAPAQKSQFQYSPGYQHIQSLYRSSQTSALPPATAQQDPIGPQGQYVTQPQPPVRRRPVGVQSQTPGHDAHAPSMQGPSYAYQSQPQYAQHPAQHPQPYNPQQHNPQQHNPQQHNPQQHNPQQHNPQQHNPQPYSPQQHNPQQHNPQAMAYAGPPQFPHGPQPYSQPQLPEKKGRGLLSSTGKLGAGLVGGFTTAVAGQQGKEKLEKWGKGKMNMFAGAMGYAPSAPSHAVGGPTVSQGPRPAGAPGQRPISYAGPPGPRPVQYMPAGPARGSVGGHPVATGMLAGAVAGGIGGVVGASLARDSNNYQPDPSAAVGAGGSVAYDHTTVVGGSYADVSGGDVSSTAAFSTQYSGYGGTGDATVYTDTTVYADGSGTTYTDTSTVYADPSGAVYTDTTTTTYADGSAYGQPAAYSGSTYTETSYAADSSSAGYGETTYTDTSYAADPSNAGYGDATYTSGADVYADTAGAADTGGIAEAVGSASGGGSWMDGLGLGSLTDMSSWGGNTFDSGASALALI